MTKITLNICGKYIDVIGIDPNILNKVEGFPEFITKSNDNTCSDLEFYLDSDIKIEQGNLIHSFDSLDQICEVFRTKDGWQMITKGSTTLPECVFTIDKTTKIAKSNINSSIIENAINLRFQLWMAIGLCLLKKGIVSIHSSVVVKDNYAVLFLGESGTGKSTHTSLWIKHIEGSSLLNDDSPFVSVDDNILCYGTPWSGKGRYYRNESFPIKAIVRLSQAKYNRIEKLNNLKSIAALFPSCPPSFAYDEDLTDIVFNIISKIIAKIPVYNLECLPDEASARLSYETIINN